MKLSVVIPVYNVAPWLRACLDSVLAAARTLSEKCEVSSEKCRGVEIICVDDGSTDGSGAILDAWVDELNGRDKRVPPGLLQPPTFNLQPSTFNLQSVIIHQKNAGVSAARNAALEVATGEWIAFVDADDTVDPDWFSKLLACATADVDLVHVNARHCFRDPLGEGRPDEVKPVGNPCRLFLREGWSFLDLVRRSAIGTVRYPAAMRFKEDVIFFAELASRQPLRVVAANLRGYNYRERAGSAIAQAVREADSRRFFDEVVRLGLPREEAGRAIGYDLALWVKGRDRSRPYDAATCPVLALWREGVARGVLRPSEDVRAWWRPGLRHWLSTGDLSWLEATCRLRLAGERLFRSLKG